MLGNYFNVAANEQLDTDIKVEFENNSGGSIILDDFGFKEVILGESLLTPGLQTSVVCDSYRHGTVKELDKLKGASVNIVAGNPLYGDVYFDTKQTIYRLENRFPIDTNNEEMTFRACDPTMLNNAINLVSKSWGCAKPSDVVRYVMRSCLGAKNIDVEDANPARDYLAENIHPFQVISQQSNLALAKDDDPSFIHYMTYKKGGTHHFRSLKSLTQQSPVWQYEEIQAGTSPIKNPNGMLSHTFPCDFDLLSDLLNGISPDGKNISSVLLFNEKDKTFSLVGNQIIGCGIGGGPAKLAKTNVTTAKNQNACNDSVGPILMLRQARMSLLENDKIMLRMTVPFKPDLHVGDVISALFQNKETKEWNYGSGDYLILHLMHNLKKGGFATTTISCVTRGEPTQMSPAMKEAMAMEGREY